MRLPPGFEGTAATLTDSSAPPAVRPTTLMLSGESTGTGVPSSVRQCGIRVDTRAQGVDGVTGRDGQHVGAVGADALPDAARTTLELGLNDTGEMRGEHFSDVPLADQVTRVQDCRRAARLQTHDALERPLSGEPGHLFRLGQVLS